MLAELKRYFGFGSQAKVGEQLGWQRNVGWWYGRWNPVLCGKSERYFVAGLMARNLGIPSKYDDAGQVHFDQGFVPHVVTRSGDSVRISDGGGLLWKNRVIRAGMIVGAERFDGWLLYQDEDRDVRSDAWILDRPWRSFPIDRVLPVLFKGSGELWFDTTGFDVLIQEKRSRLWGMNSKAVLRDLTREAFGVEFSERFNWRKMWE